MAIFVEFFGIFYQIFCENINETRKTKRFLLNSTLHSGRDRRTG